MATDAASPSRNLWQVPTFLVGIAALIAVWHARPYLHQTPAQIYEQDFSALRQALDKNQVDAVQVQTLLHKVNGVEPPPDLEKSAPYVIGSAIAVMAELVSSPEEAAELWKTARKLLETAAEKGLADGDKLRHKFRLAKTWAHTGEPPLKVIDALTETIMCGDDPTEGDLILANLYLSRDPPDTVKARDYLKDYLSHLGVPGRSEVQQRQLNQVRLKLGELYTLLKENDEARKVLERIGPDAPPDLLVEAKMQIALTYLAGEEWGDAIHCLEQARDIRGINATEKATVLYRLAEACLKANRKSDAQAAFDQLRKGTGPEVQAAAFRWAELQMSDSVKQEDAVVAFESALNDFPSGDSYDNKLLPLSEARFLVEKAVLKFRKDTAFDLSVRMVARLC